jgi:hypothetical protein
MNFSERSVCPWGMNSGAHWTVLWMGAKACMYAVGKIFLPLVGNKPRFTGLPASSLVTLLAKVYSCTRGSWNWLKKRRGFFRKYKNAQDKYRQALEQYYCSSFVFLPCLLPATLYFSLSRNVFGNTLTLCLSLVLWDSSSGRLGLTQTKHCVILNSFVVGFMRFVFGASRPNSNKTLCNFKLFNYTNYLHKDLTYTDNSDRYTELHEVFSNFCMLELINHH